MLGEGVNRQTLKFQLGSLAINMGGGDVLHIEGFNQFDPNATKVLDSIQFADGTSMSYQDVLDQGFDIDGTAGDDLILGTAVNDRIDAKAGNDVVFGLTGDDTYTYNTGDGQDWVIDAGGANTLKFGPGIAIPDFILGTEFTAGPDGLAAQYLKLTYHLAPPSEEEGAPPPIPDLVRIKDGFLGAVSSYQFDNGTTLTHAQLMAQLSGPVNLTGTAGDNAIAGSNYADMLWGGEGNDALLGQGGNDLLVGGAGDDALTGGDGADELYGGEGDDTLDGGADNDYLAGDAGVDTLSGGDGNDVMQAGEGDDTLDGGAGTDILFGESGADILTGGEGNDTLYAGADNDNLSGDAGDDSLLADAGNDTLAGGDGIDTLAGGTGDDILDGGADNDTLYGDEGDDTLVGGAGDDTLSGGAGNDTYFIASGDGLDRITDGEGINVLSLGAGIDAATLTVEQFFGDDGTDILSIGYAGGTLEIVDGARGAVGSFEFADGTTKTLGQLLAGGTAVDVRGSQASETLFGSNENDTISGNGGADVIDGQGGDDVLSGGAGADTLAGDAGNDTLIGGAGDDTLTGGTGTDTYTFGLAGGRDTIVEEANESSTLELEPGLAPSDLSAERGGDDLILRRRGTEDGVTIKNYYTQPHAWTLKDAQGNTQNLATFLSGAPGNTESVLERLRALATGQVLNVLASQGYGYEADGNLHRQTTESYSGFTRTVDYQADFAIDSRSDTASAELTAGGTYTEEFLSQTTTNQVIAVRAAVPKRYAPGTVNGDQQTTPYFYASGTGTSGFSYPVGSSIVEVRGSDGSFRGYWVYPPGSVAPNEAALLNPGINEPTTTTVTHTTVREHYAQHLLFDELSAGDGANTITLTGHAIVNAGGGNDTVIGADPQYWSSRADNERRAAVLGRNLLETGSDLVFGGAGADRIHGGSAADVLAGGAGNDTLYGQGGADVYYVDPEETGVDLIHDDGAAAVFYGGRAANGYSELQDFEAWYYQQVGYDGTGTPPPLPLTNDFAAWEAAYGTPLINPDTVRFGPGIEADDLTLSWGETRFLGERYATLEMHWASDKGIRVQIPLGDDTIGTGIEYFEFEDGTRFTMRQMIERAPAAPELGAASVFQGSAAADVFEGGKGADAMYGGGGDDTLSGGGLDRQDYWGLQDSGAGSPDLLDGGEGADTLNAADDGAILVGGQGNDVSSAADASLAVMLFNRGDGADALAPSGTMAISLGGGIALADLRLSRFADDLVVDLGAADSIRMTDWYLTYPYVRLQVVGADVRLYDLNVAVAEFDAAREIDPNLANWSAGAALATGELAVEAGTAVGGQIAWDYAASGTTALSSYDETLTVLVTGLYDPQAYAQRLGGTAGDDTLTGTPLADIISGGAGNDTLDGGAGDDTFVFNAGDGVDRITGGEGTDTIRFGAGIEADDLSLGVGSLLIRVGSSGDAIHLETFDPSDASGLHDVELFRFADGSELLYADLLARGFDLTGTAASETVTGTSVDDRINGAGGDDLLIGGAGSDTYAFGAGSGADTIREAVAAADLDVLDVAANPSAVSVVREGDNLVLKLNGTVDRVAVEWFADPTARIEQVRFADNTVWDAAAFEAMADAGVNTAPVVAAADTTLLLTNTVAAGSLFSVVDAQGDTIEQYEFWDSTAGGGHFSVGGVEAGVNVSIPVSGASLASATFTASSAIGTDLVWVRANDGQVWSDWKSWTVNSWPHLTNAAPVIAAANGELIVGASAAASSLFAVTDADGDAITQYEFYDDVAGGGHFNVNGVAQGAAQSIPVLAADLANTEYVAGATPGTGQVWVRANDGLAWGAWKAWTMTSALHIPNAAPEVSAQATQTVLLNTSTAASSLFATTDADGDAITQYEFWDSTAGNGHFTVNGVQAGVNVSIAVAAADLSSAQFASSASAGSDQVWVRASDGQDWSSWKSWTMNSWPHATNAAPVASASDATLTLSEAVAAASLYAVTDADGDAVARVQFWDDVNGGGYFRVNGVQQAAVQSIDVSAAELANTQYVGGAGPGTEQVWVRANDGLEWGAWKAWSMTTALHVPNAAPVVSASDTTLLLNTLTAASTLFAVTDADNDAITQYEFWDSTAGSGHFEVNGVQAGVNVSIAVSAADLAGTTFTAATASGTDLVWVRASDGQVWSDWKSWYMNSWPHLTNAAPVVSASTQGLLRNEAVAAASLFSVADADGDAVTQYQFWDDVNGGGRFTLNGVQQAAGQNIDVAAADLGNAAYVGGANPGTEQVWVRANDGLAWGAWKNWLMSTEGGLMRGGAGPDTLNGDPETPILEGGAGNDTLNAGALDSLLIGGAGHDALNGAGGDDLLAGGTGDDAIDTGAGSNVIAFNAGGGSDTVMSDAGASNTLSLGGGLRYQDLSLSKDGDDLVLNAGGNDSVRLKDWYNGKDTIEALQLVLDATNEFDPNSADPLYNRRVQNFDFQGLVSQFDQALAASPGLSSWAVTNALLQFHLSGSDNSAMGGDLAYWYGRNNGFTGIGIAAAQAAIGAPGFGSDAQTLHAFSGLQEGLVKLA